MNLRDHRMNLIYPWSPTLRESTSRTHTQGDSPMTDTTFNPSSFSNDPGFIPLQHTTYDEALESTMPAKIPPGRYEFQLTSLGFHEARNGRPGIRFEQSIVNHPDQSGRGLRWDGWWHTGFLTSPLLAYGGRERWNNINAEITGEEGLSRIKNGTSMLNELIGATAICIVEHEASFNSDSDELWPRLKKFIIQR